MNRVNCGHWGHFPAGPCAPLKSPRPGAFERFLPLGLTWYFPVSNVSRFSKRPWLCELENGGTASWVPGTLVLGVHKAHPPRLPPEACQGFTQMNNTLSDAPSVMFWKPAPHHNTLKGGTVLDLNILYVDFISKGKGCPQSPSGPLALLAQAFLAAILEGYTQRTELAHKIITNSTLFLIKTAKTAL